MQPTEIALAATGYTTKLASLVIEQEQKIKRLLEEREIDRAIIASYQPPCPIPPVAEVPVRVLSLPVPEDAE